MLFWLFNACSTAQDLSIDDDVIVVQDDDKHSEECHATMQAKTDCKTTTRTAQDVKAIQNLTSKDFTHPSAPSDEHNAQQQQQQQQQQQTSSPTTTPVPITDGTGSSNSDDTTPLPAEPLGTTFSHFFHTQCVQECAQAAAGDDDEDDSFLAVFDNPNMLAANRAAAWPGVAQRHMVLAAQGQLQQQRQQQTSPRPIKGWTIRVHAPRQILPDSGYEVQWQVDPPQFTGLYRVRATVVRERFEAQYPCSETGVPIEVHQEGQRIQVARLTCYRIRSRVLRQQYDTSWQHKYPAVAKFLHAVGNNAVLLEDQEESYYHSHPRGMVQSVSQLLLEDLYVHPEYRGGGLGLSLVDHACRKVGDALASVILGLPPQQQQQPEESLLDTADASLHRHAPHDEPLSTRHDNIDNEEEEHDNEEEEEDDDEDEDTVNPSTTTLEHYFGLLGFVHIHQDYMARAAGRVLLEEACPSAPVLDPTRVETY